MHTALLHHSSAVSPRVATQLLDVILGERVSRSDRPIPHVSSPSVLTGVDCLIPTSSGARVHGVGTVTSRASITGGHIVQGTAFATIRRGSSDRRLPWSHYLARPGQIETLTKVNIDAVADGFARHRPTGEHLDLDAISRRTVDAVQDRPGLDHRSAFRLARTRTRFVITAPPGPPRPDARPSLRYTLIDETARTLHLDRGPAPLAAAVEFCEDLARHDWLLTALLSLIERGWTGADSRATVIDRLKPALEHLPHLWMPAARTDAALASVWQSLEIRPALSRQWQVNVDRVRDQVALAVLERTGQFPVPSGRREPGTGREERIRIHGD